MSASFLALPVMLPVAGGFLMLLLQIKNNRLRMLYTEAVAVLTSILVWISIFTVREGSADLYSFTNGFSVSFAPDGLSCLFAGMISIMWPLVLLYAFSYMRGSAKANRFFGFYTITYGVTLGVAFSANMVTMYVFFEMLTLVTIPLVSYYENHESSFAGRKYAAYTIGGASLAFFAVVLATVYGNNGRFVYGGSLLADAPSGILQTAFLFGFFGFGAKAAVFPLHSWLPTASAAPTPVTALLHAVAVVNSGVFAVIRLSWYIFGPEMIKGSGVQLLCLLTAEFSLVYGAVMAIRERHFKRRLAYSTMSNLSYMLFGVLLMTEDGFAAGTSHMLFHGVIKMLLFLCAGAFMHCTHRSYIYEINGVGKRMPVTFVCYTLGSLSLIGIPMFCGFISKWKLLEAGAQEGSFAGILGVCCLLVSAFLCAVYTLTVSVRAFFPMRDSDRYQDGTSVREADLLMLLPIVIFTIINIVLGVCSAPVMRYLEQIAGGLL